MNSERQSIILFDGECGLCSSLVNFILKREQHHHKFQILALQSNEGQTMLKTYGLSTNNLTSVVYIKDDHYYLKSTAGLFILKDLGGWWKVIYLFMIVPRPIRDFMYNLIAKNRNHFFGKQKSCKL